MQTCTCQQVCSEKRLLFCSSCTSLPPAPTGYLVQGADEILGHFSKLGHVFEFSSIMGKEENVKMTMMKLLIKHSSVCLLGNLEFFKGPSGVWLKTLVMS